VTGIGSSLNNKLVAFAALLVLVPGLVVGIIAERSGRESLQTIIGAQLARESAHVAEQLQGLLATEDEILRSFAAQGIMREIRVDDIDKRISRALATLRDGSTVRRAYLALDPSGRVVAASNPGLIGSAPAWLPHAARFPGEEATHWELIEIPDTDSSVLTLAAATPDPDDASRTIGTLVGLLDWDAVMSVTRELEAELRAQGIRASVVVANTSGDIIGGSATSVSRVAIANAFDSGDVAVAKGSYRIDEEAGYISGRSDLTDGRGFRLLVIQSLDDALRPAQALSRRLLLAVGLALVVALFAATVAARRVIRPLSELTATIRDLPRSRPGQLRVPVRSSDEVGVLAEAFNQVAQELDRVQRELVEAERYAAVGEFASGVAHHVRTSLGVLRSSAQMLERSMGQGNARERELALMMRSEVDRLADVVNDLLHLDRRRERERKSVHVSELAQQAVSLVAPRAEEKGVTIAFSGLDDEPMVSCDVDSLHQACVNLLVNAVEVANEGDSVHLGLYHAADGWLGFEVRDDGPGIPEELREQIFKPFVTGRQGGVGLGLTYVQRVVSEHAGRIEVGPNGAAATNGTVFRVELPIQESI